MKFTISNLSKTGHFGLVIAVLAFLILFVVVFCAFYQNASYKLEPIEVPEPEPEISTEQQDSILANSVKKLLNRYRPPNAFILLMDAKSGNILAWGQREDDKLSEEPTFLKRDSFPAASLAKIVTATTAVEHGNSSGSEIPKIGRNSTLYKRQIFPAENYTGNTITLEDAFAKSNNPAMGIIGMELGKEKMQNAAKKLGFTNFNYPDSSYELAESASGFTRRNLISPLQVAKAVRKLIFVQPKEVFQNKTYEEMRNMFLKTITNGTAKTAMRKSLHGNVKNSLHIGGKTGSLDGESPKGRYDWFAGFAQSKTDPECAMIVVVMQVHGKLRNQHSTIIAGLLINEWAKGYCKD